MSIQKYIHLYLVFYYKPEITIGEIVRHLSVSRSTALRRINELLEVKLVRRVGQKKAARYFKQGE